MNRIIKFRGWDGTKMHTEALELTSKEHLFYVEMKDLKVGVEVVWMQFTGLLDKNGKEIYEGDIVTWRINNIQRTGPVYFDDLQAAFWIGKDIETGMLVLNDWMRGEHEIIGNIYSNPELINQTEPAQ